MLVPPRILTWFGLHLRATARKCKQKQHGSSTRCTGACEALTGRAGCGNPARPDLGEPWVGNYPGRPGSTSALSRLVPGRLRADQAESIRQDRKRGLAPAISLL